MKVIAQKRCPICGKRKATSEFYRDKNRLDGFWVYCKSCEIKRRRKQYVIHSEQQKEYARNQRAVHPKQIRERVKRWQTTYPERANESARRWRTAHPKQMKKSLRKWQVAHPEKIAEYHNSRRAHKVNAEGNGVTAEQWHNMKEDYNHICVYCAQKKPLIMEHVVPLSRGGRHDIDNVIPACGSCNSKKHNSSLLMFLYRRTLY